MLGGVKVQIRSVQGGTDKQAVTSRGTKDRERWIAKSCEELVARPIPGCPLTANDIDNHIPVTVRVHYSLTVVIHNRALLGPVSVGEELSCRPASKWAIAILISRAKHPIGSPSTPEDAMAGSVDETFIDTIENGA